MGRDVAHARSLPWRRVPSVARAANSDLPKNQVIQRPASCASGIPSRAGPFSEKAGEVTVPLFREFMKVRCVGAWLAIGWPAQATYAQEATRTMQPSVVDTLTFTAALAMARDASPELRAAREAVAAAVGRERQAAARGNPTLSYSREQTGHTGQSNSQDIAAVEQPIDVSGQRAARVAAARLARAAAAVCRTAAAYLH